MNPLESLRDIHEPPAIAWWPIAPGWWILFILIFVLVSAFVYWLKHRTQRQANVDYRQAAIQELHQIEQRLKEDGDEQQFIHALSVLMKRYVHAYRPDASALTGQAWLSFLDQTGGDGKFQAFHHQLCVAPYAATPITQTDELLSLVKHWMQHLPKHTHSLEQA